MGALLAVLQFPSFAYFALTFAEPLVAARKLERSEPSVPAEAGGYRVVLLGVPKRARVRAVEGHGRVVAPAIVGIRL